MGDQAEVVASWSIYKKNWQLARKTSYNNRSKTVTKYSFIRNCKDSAKSPNHVRRKNLEKEKKTFWVWRNSKPKAL